MVLKMHAFSACVNGMCKPALKYRFIFDCFVASQTAHRDLWYEKSPQEKAMHVLFILLLFTFSFQMLFMPSSHLSA
jgi:hypothetical protein